MSQTVFLNPTVTAGPVRTGTGNGTCSIDRLTHFTVEQDYTLTCIAKSPSTLFAAVGSLDGSIGIATVGTQFFDEEFKIFLTINQGATVFEVGDQFTFSVGNGTDLNQENIDAYDEWPQKNFGAGVLGDASGDHNMRYANTALAAFLYLQDLKFTAVTLGNAGNSVTLQYLQYTPAVAASRVIQDLTYTAVATGTGGNSISITYLGGGVAGSEIVGVVGSAITVTIESTVSTATQIRTAVLASVAAAALVSVAVSGTGSNAQTSAALVNLTGGAGDLGRAGSEIVSVSTNAISIRMESGVSTATQIKAAFDAAGAATALASCSIIGSSAGKQFHFGSPLSLSGGKNKNFALNHDELTDSGSFSEGNANVRIKDLRASGNAEITGHAHIGGALSLFDSESLNDSGPAIGNVQRFINRMIARGKITLSIGSSGFLTWAAPSLSGGNITVTYNDTGNTNTLDMGTPLALTDGQSAYVVLNPGVSGVSITPTVASTVPTDAGAFRLATRIGSAVILFNGTVIYDGEQARIGNAGSASTSTANAIMRRDASGDVAAHDVTMNKAIVGAGAGKGVDVASAGRLDIGATVGANNLNLGGALSTVIVLGDFIVQGTTTTLNTATLDVEDLNITVNKGGSDLTSEGAGLTVDRVGTKGSIIYAAAAASKFKIGALGAEVEVADISTAQTFTNKTAAVGSNHITGTLSRVPQFNASTGDLEASAVTNTALGYIANLSSDAQTQLDAKVAKASYRAGSAALTLADTTKAVVFSSTLGTTNYRISAILLNTTDGSAQFQPVTITAKSATGFTATWNAGVDTANYVLEYFAILDN